MTSLQRRSLTDRLQSLGVKLGTASLAPPKAASPYEVDAVVAGTFLPTPRGEVFIVEQAYTPDYCHGLAPISCSPPLSRVAECAKDPRLAEMPLSRFAFLDTETSGLAGGTGTYAFMVGIAR